MRVLIWHGYLLSGTGSNEYTRALARTLSLQGHEVVVLSQDPRPEDHDLGTAAAIRPELPGRLPVFVLDHYAQATPALLPTMDRGELDEFIDAQVAAIHAAGPADLLIANHVLLGGPVGAASGLPFTVKVHGSELEYAMRGNHDLCIWARQSLEPAADVVVGSEHVAGVLAELVGPVPARVVTPGVDVAQMVPEEQSVAWARLIEEARLDPPNPGDERLPDAGNAERFERFLAGPPGPTVVYVGKLSQEKGVHLLLEALVGMDARAVIVGFGPARPDLERMAGERGLNALFTGPLQHRHLAHLWAGADASVVPSVFPEAFGMVAAEAAATGCPPVVARHSGLAEVADGIEGFLPEHLKGTLSFTRGDAQDLREKLTTILGLGPEDRRLLSTGCRAAVESLWSWEAVAGQMLVGAMTATTEVRLRPDFGRFEILSDGQVAGFINYREGDDGSMVLVHTEMDPAFAGQGLAAALARGVFDDLTERGVRTVVPCPFLISWLGKNPEYPDVVIQAPGAEPGTT